MLSIRLIRAVTFVGGSDFGMWITTENVACLTPDKRRGRGEPVVCCHRQNTARYKPGRLSGRSAGVERRKRVKGRAFDAGFVGH